MHEHGFLEQQQSNGKSTSLGKEVAHYDYVDETTGAVSGRSLRAENTRLGTDLTGT
jgi:hypothetical protein